AAAGAGELQRDAQPVRGALLRAVGRAFGEIDELAGLDPFVLAVILPLAFEAHADLVEIMLVARDVELAALAHEGELEIVRRALLAGEQGLEFPRAAADGVAGAGLVALFGVGHLHRILLRVSRFSRGRFVRIVRRSIPDATQRSRKKNAGKPAVPALAGLEGDKAEGDRPWMRPPPRTGFPVPTMF